MQLQEARKVTRSEKKRAMEMRATELGALGFQVYYTLKLLVLYTCAL